MTYRLFDLPDYHVFLDALGVAPEHIGEGTQRLQFKVGEDEMVVTLDALGRSVHVRWLRGDREIVRFFREGAVRVAFDSSDGTVSIVIGIETDDLFGELKIQVEPLFAVSDSLLFH